MIGYDELKNLINIHPFIISFDQYSLSNIGMVKFDPAGNYLVFTDQQERINVNLRTYCHGSIKINNDDKKVYCCDFIGSRYLKKSNGNWEYDRQVEIELRTTANHFSILVVSEHNDNAATYTNQFYWHREGRPKLFGEYIDRYYEAMRDVHTLLITLAMDSVDEINSSQTAILGIMRPIRTHNEIMFVNIDNSIWFTTRQGGMRHITSSMVNVNLTNSNFVKNYNEFIISVPDEYDNYADSVDFNKLIITKESSYFSVYIDSEVLTNIVNYIINYHRTMVTNALGLHL